MDLLNVAIDELERITNIDLDKAWDDSMSTEVLDLILELLTTKQLGNQGEGISGDGNDLPEYTPFTISVRSDARLQVDHMSLSFTGDYLEETDVNTTNDGWVILKNEERFRKLVEDVGVSDTHMTLTRENKEIVFVIIRENHEQIIAGTF